MWEGKQKLRNFEPRLVKFHLIDKYENSCSIIEDSNLRPFITNYEFTKKVVFEYDDDIFVDIE